MKHYFYALGALLLLWASSVFAAQPSYEDVAPYLTKETFALTCYNTEEINLPEIMEKLNDTGKTAFPHLMAEPRVQVFLFKLEECLNESQARLDAMKKLSGGCVYGALGVDGVCLIVPVKEADAQAEKLVMSLLNDFPFVEFENEELNEVLDQIHEEVSVTRTSNAIIFFCPTAYAKSESTGENLLDEYLKKAAERPDFAEGFQKARLGKVSTILLGFPLITREEIAKRVLDFADDSPITKEEFYEIVDSARCVVFSSDSFWGFETTQIVFDSEKTAKAMLSALDKYSVWLKQKLTRDAENAEVVNDLASWLLPAVMPEQNGAVLTLELKAALEKAAAPVNALFGELARFQASQREKFHVDAKEESDRQYKELKKWITPNTALIVRLDLEKVTPEEWFQALENAAKTLLPETMNSENVRAALGLTVPGRRITESVLSAMKAHGAKEVYAILDYSNIEFLVQIWLPGVTLKEGIGNEGFLTAADLLGNAGEMKPLADAIDQNFVMGQRYETVVLLPKIGRAASMESGRIWKDFVFSQAPGNDFPGSRTSALMSGKDLSCFRDALELNAQCGISVVMQMNPIFVEVAQQGIREARENLGVKLSIPSKQLITDGLNLVALGVDPNLGLFRFNVLAKSKKSAGKMVKLLELWKQQIKEELKEDARSREDISPVYAAFMLDFTDFVCSFLMPVREENRLYWDISQNERFNKLTELVPARVLAAAGAWIFIPTPAQFRSHSAQMVTINNYKLIGLAMLNYESSRKSLPVAYTVDEEGKPIHSWRVLLLPYLGVEELELYKKIRLDEPWDSEWNRQFHDQCPKVFQSVFNPSASDAVVGVVVGDGTMFPPVTKKGQKGVGLENVTDGLSNTIMLVPCKPVCWMDPNGDPKVSDLQSPEDVVYDGPKETFPVTMGDGSVHQISVTIDPANWINLLLRNDGNEVEY